MNCEYFERNEQNDWDRLIAFNEKTRLFDHLEKTDCKSSTDATGYTVNKLGVIRKWNIELKSRNLNVVKDANNEWHISGCTESGPYESDTMFIESHKCCSMLLDTINGLEPLYINFMADGSTVIFNLSRLTKRPRQSREMNIRSKGYGKFEVAKREGLYLIDAAIYGKSNNLIKSIGQDGKKR